jgi:hypothetical protein
MRRSALALILLAASAPTSYALRLKELASQGVAQQTVQSEVVLVGKVTSFEKELTEVKAHPDAKETTAYTIAIVKVETAIRGLGNATHVKVGFVLRAEPQQGEELLSSEPRRNLNLQEGGEYLLLLHKHPVGGFYTYSDSTPPQQLPAEAAVAEAKLAAGAIADPMKALKAEKAQDRALAAIVLLTHYCQPASRGQVELVPIDAEENVAILKAIAEGDWTVAVSGHMTLWSSYQYLGLTDKDGWKHPTIKPGENHNLVMQKTFQEWLAGPGAKFRFHRYVGKKK